METMKLIGTKAENAEQEVFGLIATGDIIKKCLGDSVVRQCLLRRSYSEHGTQINVVELAYYNPTMGRFTLMMKEHEYENTLTILHANNICLTAISNIADKNQDCFFDERTPPAFVEMCKAMRLGLESYC